MWSSESRLELDLNVGESLKAFIMEELIKLPASFSPFHRRPKISDHPTRIELAQAHKRESDTICR
jgi:hypothetical protein